MTVKEVANDYSMYVYVTCKLNFPVGTQQMYSNTCHETKKSIRWSKEELDT